MPEPTVLLVSREPSLFEAMEQVTRSVGNLRLEAAPGSAAARPHLAREDVGLLVVQVADGDDSAEVIELLRALAAGKHPIAVVVISDRHQAGHALALLRQGAADYLSRPLDLNRLTYLVDVLTARARYTASRQNVLAAAPDLVQAQDGGELDPFFYVPSGSVALVMEQVERVAPQQTTVLLNGETGTGKTRLARLIHDLSPRRGEPFLVINCGALSASLIESEMFGHVRGAFTGADRDRTGKFAEVGRGTLFLDEIDALPVELQAKLLRAVEERVFEPVGSNKSARLEARLVAASNRCLEQEVQARRFRSDLYYRLNVVSFYLPPLRERRQLIRALAQKFVAHFAERNGRVIAGLTDDALDALEDYAWPGNIRELRNVIERGVALCPGEEIRLEDLPEALRTARAPERAAPANAAAPSPGATLAETKEGAEAAHILEALKRHGNNRLRAAAALGISRMTLYKKLHRYGLMAAG